MAMIPRRRACHAWPLYPTLTLLNPFTEPLTCPQKWYQLSSLSLDNHPVNPLLMSHGSIAPSVDSRSASGAGGRYPRERWGLKVLYSFRHLSMITWAYPKKRRLEQPILSLSCCRYLCNHSLMITCDMRIICYENHDFWNIESVCKTEKPVISRFKHTCIPKYQKSSVFFWNRKEIRPGPIEQVLATTQHFMKMNPTLISQSVREDQNLFQRSARSDPNFHTYQSYSLTGRTSSLEEPPAP